MGRMTETRGKITHKRGHNALITGAALLVFGIAFGLAGSLGQDDMTPLGGLAWVAAFAGFITVIVGIGLRRER